MPGTGPFRRVHAMLALPSMWVLGYRLVQLPKLDNQVDSDVHADRIRPPRQALAVTERYSRADRWRSLAGAEKLLVLRKARRAIATERRIPESRVTMERMAKRVGIPERWCRGFMLTLAGDFTPTGG